MKSHHIPLLLLVALAACNFPVTTVPTIEPQATDNSQGTTVMQEPVQQASPTPLVFELSKSSYTCVDDAEPRFARLMHDPQWMPWPSRMGAPDWNRGFSSDRYPETVPLWGRPRSGDGEFTYTREWLEYLRDLQPHEEAAIWVALPGAGLFDRFNDSIPILNLDELSVEPKAEGISSGGNVVLVLETRNGSVRIQMLFVGDDPPDVDAVNYQTAPWLVTKFTSVSIEGELGNAGGMDVYFPNVGDERCGYWVDLQRVEMFPRLPFEAAATVSNTLREGPANSSRSVGGVAAGQVIRVLEYFPQGSDVWGRTENGWLLLEYLQNGQPVYTTTWSMATRPPILFP
ncbi:MAG: hypothetical protein DWG76_06550 [Chloroflexi bacterium]|nr:hypothetical protein [Chloroflexota bacterium]